MLRTTLKILLGEEGRTPGLFKDDICSVKAQLEAIDKELYHGALIRARAGEMLRGEAPTKRALGMEKKYASRNVIGGIECCGVVTIDQAELESGFCVSYKALFSYRPVELDKFRSEYLGFCRV